MSSRLMGRVYFFADALREFSLVISLWLPVGCFFKHNRTVPVVASLTSYPPRITWAWLAVETLLRQSVRPLHLVLVLCEEEFPDRAIPYRLRRQVKRGLEIMWVSSNGRSHDKLLPVRSAFPDTPIITFDDDKFFPRNLVSELFRASENHPGHVIGARGWLIRRSNAEGEVRFGDQWTRVSQKTVGEGLFTPGGNGCLYPPNSLHPMVDNLNRALEICPTADDIWFWGAIQKNRSLIVCLGFPAHRPVRAMKAGPALSALEPSANELQFQRAIDYYGIRKRVLEVSIKVKSDG